MFKLHSYYSKIRMGGGGGGFLESLLLTEVIKKKYLLHFVSVHMQSKLYNTT